ncbi:hypothetical protein D9619_012159 [Psilocybe cf. subviscida]|uniref:Uncharacterized protein n=1 Tax=Psilocybe cf. subviscida TaxID=2480587 RepID=A0A8H5B948_9AGAR|nr:hypothetical protein D9619_012159 [Psilocybe cf. subviscida]
MYQLPFDFNQTTSPLPAASAAVDAQPPLTHKRRTPGGAHTSLLHYPANPPFPLVAVQSKSNASAATGPRRRP